jgi:hypothetical protein
MQSIFIALEATCQRIDTIETKIMEGLKTLEVKHEFFRYMSNHTQHDSIKWKPANLTTTKLTIENVVLAKPTTELIT